MYKYTIQILAVKTIPNVPLLTQFPNYLCMVNLNMIRDLMLKIFSFSRCMWEIMFTCHLLCGVAYLP